MPICARVRHLRGRVPVVHPFHSAEVLVTGIDTPQWPVNDLRQQLVQRLAAMPGPRRLVVFGCEQGTRTRLDATDVLHFPLVCAGMLPPLLCGIRACVQVPTAC